MMTIITGYLERYNVVSRELASLYQQRSNLQATLLETRQSAYAQAVSEGLAYNPATAQAKTVTIHWEVELAKLAGDIDAYLIELRYLDQLLIYTKYSKGVNGESH